MSGGPPPVPGGRTPEEREAARLERERRRASRAGAEPPSKGPPRAPKPSKRRKERQGPPDWLARARELTARSTAPARENAAARTGDGRPPRGPRRWTGRPGRGRALLGFALVGGLLALAAAWFLLSLFQPFAGDGRGEVRVTIPRGSSVGQIGDLLERRGVVPSSFFFSARARLSGRSGELKPGAYRLRRDMSYAAALDALAQGPPPDLLVLTIPEGRSRREVAELVGDGLSGSYMAATRRSRGLDPREYGARSARSLEGFLFPATYELKRRRPVGLLVAQQLAAFERNFDRVDLSAARRRRLTPYEVLIVASMVEREAQVARERRLIAGVIYNRLRQGIPLGIDATIRFATNNWERPLTQSQLQIDSPYNTRNRQGLPPGPIGSPGLDSIHAAAAPARTPYLYYVVKPCGEGEHAFARTDAEFQRLVERYNAARQRQGGRSPTRC